MSDYMGHGRKQRDVVKMTDGEIDAFLAGPHTATMCTLYADGSVHAVGMWYGFLEGSIALESKAKAQKVRNLARDPRITILVEEGTAYENLKGVSLIGTAEIIDDRDKLWKVAVSLFSRYYQPYTEEMAPFVEALMAKRVAIKVHPKRVVSWDHSKLRSAAP